MSRLPEGLLFGTATSSRQVEGGDHREDFARSLLDGSERAEGWSAPFGLLALDRGVYAAICRARGIPRELAPTVRA